MLEWYRAKPYALPLRRFRTNLSFNDMSDIKNTRGKGYCMLYLFMGLFFITALVLMLYNRNFILDFPK